MGSTSYYHYWESDAINNRDRGRRRFVNMIVAFAFSNYGFAYLYYYHNGWLFRINSANYRTAHAILFSSYSAFFSDYNVVSPVTMIGHAHIIAQYIVTFVFITIVFAASLTETAEK
jgi:hypothetical protein